MAEALNYGREAFDFIDKINGLSKVSDVMNTMEKTFNRFGFETIIVTGLPNPDEDFANMVLAKKWPAEWFKIYTENQYDRVDPVVRHCKRSLKPFEWSEAPYDPVREPSSLEVMRSATEFRMSKGFIVPIHGFNGFESAVSLGGVNLDLNNRTKPAVHLMSIYAFERIRGLLKTTEKQPVKLTPREQEVLSWVAEGKSYAQIAEQLIITERTVEQHMENVRRKLGAMNSVHAMAIAIRTRKLESFS